MHTRGVGRCAGENKMGLLCRGKWTHENVDRKMIRQPKRLGGCGDGLSSRFGQKCNATNEQTQGGAPNSVVEISSQRRFWLSSGSKVSPSIGSNCAPRPPHTTHTRRADIARQCTPTALKPPSLGRLGKHVCLHVFCARDTYAILTHTSGLPPRFWPARCCSSFSASSDTPAGTCKSHAARDNAHRKLSWARKEFCHCDLRLPRSLFSRKRAHSSSR